LVIIAAQVNRPRMGKEDFDLDDSSEDIRKAFNADVIIAVNQKTEDKLDLSCTLRILKHRYNDFDKRTKCIVLQSLAVGRTYIDSEYVSKSWLLKYKHK
jgi:hypothetical protein